MVGSSGFSEYDTHTTVAVWLLVYRRWGIVPTFGGIFTRGNGPRPLGAASLRDALVQHRADEIVWRGSHGKNAQLPSAYYVNPVYFFRYVGAYGWVDGQIELFVLPDFTMLSSGVRVIGEPMLRLSSPNEQVGAVPAGWDWIAARRTTSTLPPAYTSGEVWSGHVMLSAEIDVPDTSVVVWASARGLTISGYAATAVNGGSLSPILGGSTLELDGDGDADVDVHAARVFPHSHEG